MIASRAPRLLGPVLLLALLGAADGVNPGLRPEQKILLAPTVGMPK